MLTLAPVSIDVRPLVEMGVNVVACEYWVVGSGPQCVETVFARVAFVVTFEYAGSKSL